MQIQINNRSIFFAIENVWESLNYKFKYQLNQLVAANSADDYVQTVEIDKDTFVQIMRAVNNQPQGIAKDINKTMYDALAAQITQMVQNGDQEAQELLTLMQSILVDNADMLEKKVLNGKTQILQ